MRRIGYALYFALKYKKKLYAFLTTPALSRISITALTPDYFRARHLNYIVLDFDGVLANHGAIKPLPEVEAWLNKMMRIFPASHFALLSNKPFDERLQYFKDHYPNMLVLSGVPKKPYPEGLNQLVKHFSCKKNELVLVDDRLLTGMLAVCLAGVEGVYISNAYKDLSKRPIVEIFFMLLRKFERTWIRWLKK
jgi:predicted HAD superfamily phosphohydrolase YqeG